MSGDIVERLCARVAVFKYADDCKPTKRLRNPDGLEAATLIESLRSDNAAMREREAKAAAILVQARDGKETYHRARIISALNALNPEPTNEQS